MWMKQMADHQVSLNNAAETIQGKHQFELTTGVYKPEAFVKDLELRKQTMKYCAIRTVSESARAMLLHAAIHWPILFLNTVVAVFTTVICACFVDVDS